MTIFDNTYKSSKLYMVDLDDWKYSSHVPMSLSALHFSEEISRALPLRVSLFTHCLPYRVAMGSEGLQPLSRFGEAVHILHEKF